ncbi:hypothetical protein BHE74_00047719 [Ensete ventricosum]|nr:hypothetical protein BHE74_00047719 [Ensete ventricosum]
MYQGLSYRSVPTYQAQLGMIAQGTEEEQRTGELGLSSSSSFSLPRLISVEIDPRQSISSQFRWYLSVAGGIGRSTYQSAGSPIWGLATW